MWGAYTRRVILLLLEGDIARARATAAAMWGAGTHITARLNSYYAMNAACTEAEAATWRAAINTYTGARWYIADAESGHTLDSNSPFGTRSGGAQWTDVTEDVARVRTDHYVTPDGAGDGSEASPCSLAAALAAGMVQPGDTIHVAPGLYVGDFVVGCAGRKGRPITIRFDAWWGSVIEGSLQVRTPTPYIHVYQPRLRFSQWTTRTSQQDSSNPTDIPQSAANNGALFVDAEGSLIINPLLDNNRIGIGWWRSAVDSRIYGVIVLHNGWRGPDRNHGPGCYFQNDSGHKRLDCSVFAGNYGLGGIYMVSTSAPVNNITCRDNASIQNNARIGSQQPGENLVYDGNWHGANALVMAGGFGVQHKSLTFTNNQVLLNPKWFNGVSFYDWERLILHGNTISGNQTVHPLSVNQPIEADGNTYYWTRFDRPQLPDGISYPFTAEGVNLDWAGWQAKGYDLNGRFHEATRPASVRIIPVLEYGLRQWNVCIDNPAGALTMDIDLAGQGLVESKRYRAYNVLDMTQTQEFVWAGGAVRLNVDLTQAVPVGDSATPEPVGAIWPYSGIFVVREL